MKRGTRRLICVAGRSLLDKIPSTLLSLTYLGIKHLLNDVNSFSENSWATSQVVMSLLTVEWEGCWTL